MKKLSIIIPVFNECTTIIPILEKINSVDLQYDLYKEIIIVDDASTDGTATIIHQYIKSNPDQEIQFFQHQQNTGKGGCIHTAIKYIKGDYILIQDADLEYDPADYNALLQPMTEGNADVVYGSRFIGGRPHRILFFWHSIGNKLLSFFSNMLTNLNLTDMENGYKLFRANILKSISLKEKRFGFEPEITAKIAKIPGIKIYEIGIAYYGRTYEEGKKINWKDGMRAVYSILKYNAFSKEKTFQSNTNLFHYKNAPAYLLMLLFFIAGIVLIFTAKGTGDEGDSVMHYLFARHSWQYPEHFFNQWAKPLYVLIASPFAQMGMYGIKLFNVIVSTLTLYFTFRSAQKLNVPYPWLVPLCVVFAPFLMIVTLSGLTEPLFALWMISGIYFLLQRKYVGGLLWLSLLPFLRSEGLIILSVIFVYLFYKKMFKYIPLLAIGHLVYGFAGYFIHHDFLWVFKTLSYAVLTSAYGQGTWGYFYHSMPEVIGKVLCFFLIFGLVYGVIQLARKYLYSQKNAISVDEVFLVYGIFAAYFIGHTAFWALGIFNSFGLIRVMVGVLPLIAIICARGFNFFGSISTTIPYKFIVYIGLVLIMAYPFLGRKYSFNWQWHFSLKPDQVAEDRLASYVKKNYANYKEHVFYYEACYISVTFGINHFDTAKHKRLFSTLDKNNFQKGSFIVWDDWFAPVEGRVEEDQLLNDARFELLKTDEEPGFWGGKIRVNLFRVK